MSCAIVSVSMLACAKADRAATDSPAAKGGTNASTNAGANAAANAAAGPNADAKPLAATQRRDPGALPKPLDSLSGDELFTFTRTLTYGGGEERRRRCRGNASCRGPRPKDSTLVRIDAVQQEDSLSANGLSANGVIGARALNRGSLPDSIYNTRPGKDYEYYLVVLPAGPGVATWKLVELTTTQGARAHRTVSNGQFHECNHPFQRGARAAFKTCAQAATLRQASFKPFFQSDGEPPIWIGCAFGCCTADGSDGRG